MMRPKDDVVAGLVCTVLPTFNERENIGPLIRRLLASVTCPYAILVVDDDSPDRTWEEAERVAASSSPTESTVGVTTPVRVVRRTSERGLTSAIRYGIDEAIRTHGARVVTWMDCDLSMPPEDTSRLLECLLSGRADVAVGSRWIPGGSDRAHGVTARILSWTINRMAVWMLGDQVHDYTSGFIAARSEVLERVPLAGDYGEYCIDFLCRAGRLGYRLEEVAYQCVPRASGISKTGVDLLDYLKKGRKYVWTIWQLWRDSGRRTHEERR
ncbi:MAG: polyprenol monophosphomannose synthase [Vicinamibacteria bacterium]